ncbi:hypothetical protein FPV67DRAFT_1670468 [Lyophyllum atratum]|nr:hypothetical protein FPV67DRAFT_1670468 [Lyophyllum atratum]
MTIVNAYHRTSNNMNDIQASAFSSITVRKAAYACIREEISALEAVTRSWWRRHNELSLILRLPPEILAMVFQQTALLYYKPDAWIRVSHVCSHWRSVSLKFPNLWTDISFDYPRWAEEMLSRSKMASLRVAIWFDYYCKVDCRRLRVIKMAIAQLPRVKELSLHRGRYRDRMQEMESLDLIEVLSSPAPRLESLNICLCPAGDRIKLPDNLFSGVSPRLTTLKLTQCGLNWRSRIFSNLTFLEVHDIPYAWHPTVAQVIAALSDTPRLETLRISSDFAPAPVDVTTPTWRVLRLRILAIKSSLRDCAFFLDHIAFPTTAEVEVECHFTPLDHDVPAVVEHLAVNLGKRLPAPIRSLEVRQEEIQVYVSPGIPWLADALAEKLTMICLYALSLEHVESLFVSCHLNETFWRDYFGGLRRLEKLRIGRDLVGFLDAFSYGTSAALEKLNQRGAVKFTALQILRIEARNLTRRHWLGKSYLGHLRSGLRARIEEGIILPQLELEDCCDEIRYLHALQEIVEKVDWYGNDLEGDEELESESSESELEYSDNY